MLIIIDISNQIYVRRAYLLPIPITVNILILAIQVQYLIIYNKVIKLVMYNYPCTPPVSNLCNKFISVYECVTSIITMNLNTKVNISLPGYDKVVHKH